MNLEKKSIRKSLSVRLLPARKEELEKNSEGIL
jgi:hypothetical protein